MIFNFYNVFICRQTKDCKFPEDLLHQFIDDPVLCTTFPGIYKLVQLLSIIPVSTASVERGFSLMKNVCTPLRNRLGQVCLDNIMRICLEGPQSLSESDLDALLIDFKNRKQRQIAL